jgi:hypothetical protein
MTAPDPEAEAVLAPYREQKKSRIDVGLDYAEAFLQYIEKLPGENKVLRPLPVKDHSTQRFVDVP